MAKTLPRRDEVPDADRWAVETVYPDEAAWQAAFAQAEAAIPTLVEYRGTLGSGAGTLLAALKARDDLSVLVSRVHLYASMLREGDLTDQTNLARAERVDGLYARFQAAAAYYEPEILDLGADRLDVFLREEPQLEPYR